MLVPARSQQDPPAGHSRAHLPQRPPEEGEQDAIGDEEDEREPWFERVLGRFGLRSREIDPHRSRGCACFHGGENEGFSAQERAMLRNVLGLPFHAPLGVMRWCRRRRDIIAVSAETPLGELLRIFRRGGVHGHSRLPVYGETLDDPKGDDPYPRFSGISRRQG